MDEDSPDRPLQAMEPPVSSRRRGRYRKLFEECWTPIRTVVESQLQSALIDTLGPVAKSEEESDAKRVKVVLMRDRAFVQAYLEALHPELIASIGSFVAARGSEGGGARALSLVGHADSEFDAAIDQCAARLRNSVDTEFVAVKVRLINLLQDSDLRDSDLPFRVALFVRAGAGALRHIGIVEPDVVPLMRLVSSGLGGVVAQAYKQIEQRLADSGASDAFPVWQPTVVGQQSALRGRAPTVGGGAVAGGERAVHEGLSAEDAQSRSVLLTLLERFHPVAPSGAGPGAPAVARSAEAGGSAPTAQAERIAFLESRVPGSAIRFDPILLSAINQALQATATVGAEPARPSAAGTEAASTAELRKGLIDTASRKLDKLTIELVGLLFDRIQRDRHVPDSIKEQLARLQFPLLK
ncbi:MAG TPA: DUF1631 family protein, partial [Burkholderiaceae bacterium]|nr:DUF1631 family protein [Burkholderiaceae bacterium]